MTSVKTAISLPEDVFASLDSVAKAAGQSRSAIIAEAIVQYLRKLETAELTRQWNEMADMMTQEERDEQASQLAAQFRRHSVLLDRLGYVWED